VAPDSEPGASLRVEFALQRMERKWSARCRDSILFEADSDCLKPDIASRGNERGRNMHPHIYLSEQQICDRYGLSPRTLQRWRTTGDGPPFVRLGPRRIAYREADIESWAAARTYPHRAAELAAA
jgi:predicted DNA-binding transcriptional regulator AlpA